MTTRIQPILFGCF